MNFVRKTECCRLCSAAARALWGKVVVRPVDVPARGEETRLMTDGDDPLTDSEFQALAAFRYELRRFMSFSEDKARGEGLTVQQHQALLSIRGEPGESTIGTVAEKLLIEHHSASELVKRLVARGLLTRQRDDQDRRRVTLQLTREAEEILTRLSSSHRAEIERMQPTLSRLLNRLVRQGGRTA